LQYYHSQSVLGRPNTRGFSANCGSRLTGAEAERSTSGARRRDVVFAANPHPEIIGITASNLDDPTLFQPTMDIFVADAQHWDLLDPNSPKHEQYMSRG
jgi:hypothetical protein